MRDYGKLHTKFFLDLDVQRLSLDAAYLLIYFILGPQSTALGAYRCPVGFVRDDLRWDEDRVSKAIQALQKKKFITFDRKFGWVYVRRFLKWNRTDSTNAVIHIGNLYLQVPPKARFHDELLISIAENVKVERFKDDVLTVFQRRLNAVRTTEAYSYSESEFDAHSEIELDSELRAGAPAPSPQGGADTPPNKNSNLPSAVVEKLSEILGPGEMAALKDVRFENGSLVYETDMAKMVLKKHGEAIRAAVEEVKHG